ncbi:MAG: hypothetical protein J6M60_00825 [Clostridia bacterium]|nr:hypothetical protein [Clostridia bacterium]
MNKREFMKLINESMENLSLEQQENFLNKIRDNWLPEIKEKFYNGTLKNYTKCWNCKKYSLTKDFELVNKTEEHKGVLVYSDCGYGDNDEFADVTYLIEYKKCPKCKALEEKSRMYISEKNRHSRYD